MMLTAAISGDELARAGAEAFAPDEVDNVFRYHQGCDPSDKRNQRKSGGTCAPPLRSFVFCDRLPGQDRRYQHALCLNVASTGAGYAGIEVELSLMAVLVH